MQSSTAYVVSTSAACATISTIARVSIRALSRFLPFGIPVVEPVHASDPSAAEQAVGADPLELACSPRDILRGRLNAIAFGFTKILYAALTALIELSNSPMPATLLASISSWALVALGVAHVGFGIVKFKTPLLEAVASGFVGRFGMPEVRRTAFWFVMFGLPLILAGHIAVRASDRGDLSLLRIIGGYVFATSLVGAAAFPKSPFPASLLVSVLLVLAGLGF